MRQLASVTGDTLISVIIPAFNEEALLGQTIERIRLAIEANQGKGYSWETIVCNDNSADRTTEVAEHEGAKAVFEPITQILRARNTGAAAALDDWFLFVVADSYPRPKMEAEVLQIT